MRGCSLAVLAGPQREERLPASGAYKQNLRIVQEARPAAASRNHSWMPAYIVDTAWMLELSLLGCRSR